MKKRNKNEESKLNTFARLCPNFSSLSMLLYNNQEAQKSTVLPVMLTREGQHIAEAMEAVCSCTQEGDSLNNTSRDGYIFFKQGQDRKTLLYPRTYCNVLLPSPLPSPMT